LRRHKVTNFSFSDNRFSVTDTMVFQKWTDFELLSWPYYMQVFAERTFNVNDIV